MEYTFNFRYNRDGDGMVFTNDNKIGGMINTVGTMVLSFTNKNDIKDFKKYCDDNKIKHNKFFGSDDFVVVNQNDFEVNGLPRGYVTESKDNDSHFADDVKAKLLDLVKLLNSSFDIEEYKNPFETK